MKFRLYIIYHNIDIIIGETRILQSSISFNTSITHPSSSFIFYSLCHDDYTNPMILYLSSEIAYINRRKNNNNTRPTVIIFF